ncbi:rhodanese-like domain-containing protein [Halalkalicoccus jeotgali]|uniref:Rhodanese domain-containing protein n=1 Tax=Halalkalicoccus jeotgali (strain DSM 18796 / CECT 7217 / JCM 14584 / KCTC 4019 / B3) TaxID=795797 RepID=D8J979_HALJB|nr:rhodanese-like domain-containing protein [Halalkalicoccus jeotgali]ADJ16348.1 hypothetical protein HacjB3_14845 [Halalkalicoccus jeotgali B3]ELY37082.1 hypothetical protein C497_10073 [Halalkalicoccus jeotgali B3]
MVEELTPEEVKEKVEEGEVRVVDIRSPAEFERGHIPGAINVPMTRLPSEIDQHDWDGEVVVACPIGKSSIQAAKLIGSYEGVENANRIASMEGGYDAWEYDLESGEA